MIRPLRRLADWAVPPEALACIGRVRWCPVEPDRAHAVQTIAHRLNVPLSLLDYVVTDQGTWLRPWPSLEERMGMMLRSAFDRMAQELADWGATAYKGVIVRGSEATEVNPRH